MTHPLRRMTAPAFTHTCREYSGAAADFNRTSGNCRSQRQQRSITGCRIAFEDADVDPW